LLLLLLLSKYQEYIYDALLIKCICGSAISILYGIKILSDFVYRIIS